MNEIGNNIKKLRTSRGMTQQQLADVVGAKTYTTITKWEKGDNAPQGKDLITLSNYFNVSVDSILGMGSNKLITNINEYTYMPHSISAGLPNHVEAIIQAEKISIPDTIMGKYSGSDDIYISRINGDSMDKLMSDGSLIAIKPINLSELKDGDMVVFSNDHEYSVKYFYKALDKLIFKPYSTNHNHHEQHYDLDADITIHGKVVTYIVNLD